MIYTHIPYAPKKTKNLGQAYNQFMSLLQDEDVACFIDHDAMFTTPDWYDQIEHIVVKYPDAGLFTAKANRIKNRRQLYQGVMSEWHDVGYHRRIGRLLQQNHYDDVSEVEADSPVSGVVLVMKKQIWNEFHFKDGFLGVDNEICCRLIGAGRKVYIMEGVYIYHWYRGERVINED